MSVQTAKAKQPLVAIVGRPNVGKSALFNRLTGSRRAIVTDEPGITRDRLYGRVTWLGRSFEVVDTGGLVPDERATMAQEILRQARVAIDAAAKVVLVVDARAGVTPLDADLARLLVRTGKPVILAVNKVDTARLGDTALPFHELGIQPVIPLSAEHGLGVDDLLDALTRDIPLAEEAAEAEALNVAIIGRPNVGKSTLLNQLVGGERVLVSPEPGTTRDAVDTLLSVDGGWWRLIDTAGIRRKGKTKLLAEKLSVVMARKHLERADVAVLLLDATEGVASQDATIGGYAHESGRSIILAVNKWDALPEKQRNLAAWTDAVRQRFKFLDYAPLVFLSALKGQHVGRLRGLISQVGAARQRRLSDEELKEFLAALPLSRATVPGGRPTRIRSMVQVGAAPPSFLIRADLPRHGRGTPKLHFGFERFLQNQLRARFGFLGTPIRLRLVRGGPLARGRRR
jgi:GTP-binding protein